MQLGGQFLFVWLELSWNKTETVRACNLGFQITAGVSAQEFTNYLVYNLRGKCHGPSSWWGPRYFDGKNPSYFK